MIKEWRKFKGWAVLEHFLRYGERIHIKSLSKKLKISPQTAQYYLQFYEKHGILEKTAIGNMLLYSLKPTPITLELKRLYFMFAFYPLIADFIKSNTDINTLALYGSHASGEYDMKSDIDLLIISQNRQLNLSHLKPIERKLEKEVKTQTLSIGEWKNMVRKGDNFALSVLKKHIILSGAAL